MDWVQVGAKCVCVTNFWQANGIEGPALDEIVTISEIYSNPAGLTTLRFREHYGWLDENSGVSNGYSARRFRPLVSPTQEEDVAKFRGLLAPFARKNQLA